MIRFDQFEKNAKGDYITLDESVDCIAWNSGHKLDGHVLHLIGHNTKDKSLSFICKGFTKNGKVRFTAKGLKDGRWLFIYDGQSGKDIVGACSQYSAAYMKENP